MLDWINHRLGTQYVEADLAAIKNFSLLWNIFEAKICDTDFSLQKVQQALDGVDFDRLQFDDYLHYFQNRYVDHGVLNARFPYLHLRPNNNEPLVIDVLLNNVTDTKSIILAMIIIVYRYRNNLFHGLKEIREIDGQRANFETANSFLQTFLNYYF